MSKSYAKIADELSKGKGVSFSAIKNNMQAITDDFDAFLATEGLDVVVELIGGTGIAKEFILLLPTMISNSFFMNRDVR